MEDFKTAFIRFAIGAIVPTLKHREVKEGSVMADVSTTEPFEQLEARLRADLENAEKVLRNATPEEKPLALRQFKESLHRFSVWVLTGRLEPRHG